MILIIIFICLGAIIYQDLKYRHIHIVWPILLFMSGVYELVSNFRQDSSITIIATNSTFFLFTFLILIAYMSLKNKSYVNPFKNYFGLGDLLFYIAITPFFILPDYILFFIFSMVFSILIFLIFKKVLNKTSIPLAGYASLLLLFFLCKNMLLNHQSVTLIKILE